MAASLWRPADEAEKTWATFMDWVRVSILTGAEGAAAVGDFTVDNLIGNSNGKAALRDLPTPPPGARGGGGLVTTSTKLRIP